MPLFDPAARSAQLAAAMLGAALLLATAGSPIRAAEPEAARVIVKFKAGSSLARMQALSLAGDETGTRVRTLGARTGLGLRGGLALGERSQVMTASGMASAELASRLAADPEVEYAVVDRRRRLLAAPNDPLYAVGGATGPVAGQWYLRPPNTTTPSAINAESAWDTTTGSSSIVVAVLDTGVRFDHADMARVGSGGNLLPGYDFVSDGPTANDGDGRDADASDPGDWITSAENATGGAFAACGVSNSSWHGTEVAGLIGATTNNGVGMASVGRNVRVLPVRVLGKCGGFDSDIIAGMRWAAGLTVPGVPANTTPAKVINMSLGGEGACTSAYANVVSELTAAGVTIVASAGNSAGHAVSEPANCPGVIGVGGLRHVGTKVGFSDLGPQLTISAPGGNCVDVRAGSACQYPILTARNAGTTTPVAGSSVYSDSFAATVGTSFSSPLVAATAGLMLSVRPSLTPLSIRLLLQQTARAFPESGAGNNDDGSPVGRCTHPQLDSTGKAIEQLQCYCTTGVCGAGMLNVAGAVQAAATGFPAPSVAARIDLPNVSPKALARVVLSSANSAVAADRTIISRRWTLVDGGGVVSSVLDSTAQDAAVLASAAGRVTVRLTVTDSAGGTSSAETVVAVGDAAPGTTAPVADTGSSGGGAVSWPWLLLLAAAVLALRRAQPARAGVSADRR